MNRTMDFSKYPRELIKSISGEIDVGMIQVYYCRMKTGMSCKSLPVKKNTLVSCLFSEGKVSLYTCPVISVISYKDKTTVGSTPVKHLKHMEYLHQQENFEAV